MRTCPHCGREQPDENIYCSFCLKSMIQLRQQREIEDFVIPESEDEEHSTECEEQKTDYVADRAIIPQKVPKGKKTHWFPILLIAAAVLGGSAAYLTQHFLVPQGTPVSNKIDNAVQTEGDTMDSAALPLLPEQLQKEELSDAEDDETDAAQMTDESELDVEDEVKQIQRWYYAPTDREQLLTVDGGTDGWRYIRKYYYHDGALYFAFIFDGTEEHRLYFKDDVMIRYIDEAMQIYDYGNLEAFAEWEDRAVEEAYRYASNAESSNLSETDKENNATDDARADRVSMSDIENVSATSALSEYNMTHVPYFATDGDVKTGWVEGVAGQGIGEVITLSLRETRLVSGFTINGGYQKSDDLYAKNSRPARITVACSDGESQSFDLEDIYGEQKYDLSTPIETASVSFKIEAVYAGDVYEDTVISEITLY